MHALDVIGIAVTLIMCHQLQAAGYTEPQDAYALRILYESLRSPSLAGWKPNGDDPCGEHWHGVECSGHNIVAVRLPGLKLRGSLGYALNKFTSLSILDLSHNHIGELLPFEFPSRISHLNLASNVLIGPIPYSMKRLFSLTSLNLSTNFLSSAIPDIFEKLSSLHTFDISNNNFTGELPSSIGSLVNLATLHIQQNELNGTLNTLEHLPLKDLNVENNDFSGTIPPTLRSVPKFRGNGNRFDDSSWFSSSPSHEQSNPAMQLQSPRPHQTGTYETSSGTSSFIRGAKLAGITAAAVIAAFLLVFSVLAIKRRSKIFLHSNPKTLRLGQRKPLQILASSSSTTFPVDPHKQVDKEQQMIQPLPMEKQKTLMITSKAENYPIAATSFSLEEIQNATGNFGRHSLIGEGSLGSVYHGKFSSGQVLAIKKLDSSLKEEETLIRIISKTSVLCHENIVELIGYCLDKTHCFLAYPYFSKGTVHDHLHASANTNLTWNQRMKISLGAARALEYLHEVASPATIHRNFKSANILLDQEWNPLLADTGLAALVPLSLERQISSQMFGSFGYSAPEYALAGIYTVKSDVYSFGVFMLELLTGREPLDSSRPRSKEQSLVAWAVPRLNDMDSLASIVDPKLEGMYPAKALSRYAEIILQCVQTEAGQRPAMSEVVQSLNGLMHRAGVSKRTVSREMPLQPGQGAAATNEVASTSSPVMEKAFHTQHLSDSIVFTM